MGRQRVRLWFYNPCWTRGRAQQHQPKSSTQMALCLRGAVIFLTSLILVMDSGSIAVLTFRNHKSTAIPYTFLSISLNLEQGQTGSWVPLCTGSRVHVCIGVVRKCWRWSYAHDAAWVRNSKKGTTLASATIHLASAQMWQLGSRWFLPADTLDASFFSTLRELNQLNPKHRISVRDSTREGGGQDKWELGWEKCLYTAAGL